MFIHYGVAFTITDQGDEGAEAVHKKIEEALFYAGLHVGPIQMIDRRENKMARRLNAHTAKLNALREGGTGA